MKKHFLVLLPWLCMCVGAALNVIVMSANGGVMPVAIPRGSDWFGTPPGALLDTAHVAWYSGIHLAILADWIQVKWIGTCSPGDLVLWFGEWFVPYGVGAWVALCWRDRKQSTR